MPKNRDYTGLERTPSSMAWLIGQRAKLRGQLDRYRAQEAALPEKIRTLEYELASLDAVIPLHAVKVDASAIVGKRPNRPRTAPHDELKRSLVRSLKAAKGQPVTTIELVLQFVRQNNIDLAKVKQADIMDSARKCLSPMADRDVVRRCHPAETTQHGSWAWAEEEPGS